MWPVVGYDAPTMVEWFDESKQMRVNIVHGRMVVLTLVAPMIDTVTKVASLTYASPKPLVQAELMKHASDLIAPR